MCFGEDWKKGCASSGRDRGWVRIVVEMALLGSNVLKCTNKQSTITLVSLHR